MGDEEASKSTDQKNKDDVGFPPPPTPPPPVSPPTPLPVNVERAPHVDKYKKDVSAPPPRLVSLPPRETGDGSQSSPPSGDDVVKKRPAAPKPEPAAEPSVKEPPERAPEPVTEAVVEEPPVPELADKTTDKEQPPSPASVTETPSDEPPAPTPAAEAPAEDPPSSDPDSHSKCVAHMISQDNVAFYCRGSEEREIVTALSSTNGAIVLRDQASGHRTLLFSRAVSTLKIESDAATRKESAVSILVFENVY